jgi:DedD protein
MDSETPIVRYIAGAVGVVLVCFCVGYFLLGPRPGSATPVVSEASPSPEPSTLVVRGPAPKLTVLETTPSKPPQLTTERRDTVPSRVEATPAPKPSPQTEATPAPVNEGRKPRRDGDEPLKLPAPKADEKPADDEEVQPADPADDTTKPTDGGGPDTVYRVRVKDSFGSHDDADQLASELKGRGFSATVMPAGKGKFEVQIGAYKDKKRAEEKQKELEKNSYKTRIADKELDLDKTEKDDKGGEKDPEKSDKSNEKGKTGEGQ